MVRRQVYKEGPNKVPRRHTHARGPMRGEEGKVWNGLVGGAVQFGDDVAFLTCVHTLSLNVDMRARLRCVFMAMAQCKPLESICTVVEFHLL